jgi:hypothetical protein
MAAPKELHKTVEWMESRGQPNAVSGKGARGPMQVMDATARSPGYGITPIRNNSVAERERVGHEYLDALYDTHGGDPALTMAAYNAGPGAVQKYGGVPPYRETRNYVGKGLQFLQLAGAQPQAQPTGLPTLNDLADVEEAPLTPELIAKFKRIQSGEAPPPQKAMPTLEDLADVEEAPLTPELKAKFERINELQQIQDNPQGEQPGRISSAFSRGWEGLKESTQGIGLGITSALGNDPEAQAQMEGIKTKSQEPQSGRASQTFQNIQDIYSKDGALAAAKELPGFAMEKTAESIPGMAPALGMGLAAGAVNPLLALPVTAGAYIVQQFGDMMHRQALEKAKAEDLSPSKAVAAAIPAGFLDAVTDRFTLGLGKKAKAVFRDSVEQEVKKNLLTRMGTHAVKSGTLEAGVGATQSELERAQAGLPITGPEAGQEAKEAGASGFFGALIPGAAGGVSTPAPQPSDTETAPPDLAAQTEQAKAVDEENNAKKKAARVEDFGVAPKSKLFKSLMDADLTTQEGIDAAKAAVDEHAPDDFDYEEFDSHINAAERAIAPTSLERGDGQVLKSQEIPEPTLRGKNEPWNPKTPDTAATTPAQAEEAPITETEIPDTTATAQETEVPTVAPVEKPTPVGATDVSETTPPSSEAAPKPTLSDVTKAHQEWNKIKNIADKDPSPENIAERDAAQKNMEKLNEEFQRTFALSTEPETQHTAKSLERHLPKELKAMVASGKAVLHDTQATLPGENHPPNVKGMTDASGTTHYVANRLTPNTIESVMLHEAGVHAGMAKLVGPKLWEQYKAEAMNSQDPAFIVAREAVPKSTPEHLIPEEALAHLVEHAPKHSLVRRLISAIRNWARANLGIGSKFTEADARQLAVSALKHASPLGDASGPRADTAYALSSSEEAAAAAREQRIKANPPKGINKRPTNLSRTVLKIENEMFDYSSGLYNQLRPRLEKMGLATPEVQKIMAQAFQGQTVYVNSLAAQGAIQGELHYNPNTMQWEAKAGQFSITKMKDILAKHAKKQGKPFETVSGIFTDIASALRIKEFREQAATYREAIDMATDPKVKAMAERKFANILRRADVEHMTDDQIATALKPLADHPEYAEALKEWHGVRAYMVKFLVDTGRYSEKQAKAYMDATMYVPFNRLMDAKDPDAFYGYMAGGRGRSLMANQKEHAIKGSEREVKDMVENMEKWILNSFVKGVKNAKNLELQEVVAKHFYQGAVKQVENTKNGGIKVYRHGREEYWEYEDPLLTSAFNGVNTVALPTLTMAAKFANRLRNAIVLDPLFTINQLPQDAYSAMFSSGVKNPGALLIDIAKEWVGTLKGTTDAHEHLKGIGIVGQKDTISMATEHIHELAMHGRAKKGPFAALHRALEHFANVGDNAIRQGIYVRTMKEMKGQPNAQMIAQQRAFEVINFRKRGANATLSAFMQVTPFLGAYLQATRTQLNIISGRGISPVARKEALMRLAATSAQVATFTFLYNMMLGDDDEFKKKDIQERDTHIYPFGSKSDYAMTVRADVFSLPFIAMNHVYRYLMDKGSENPYQTRQAMLDAMVRILAGAPMGPTVIKPVLENVTGIDFYTNRPIIPERYKHLSGTPELQYNEKTSELAKLLGHAGLSPFLVDHFIKGYFGYAGATTMMVTDMALRAGLDIPYTATREDQTNIGYGKSAKDIPGMPLRNDRMTQGVDDFYNLGGAAREAKASVNRFEALGKTKEAREFKRREASLLLGRPENRRLLSESVQKEMNKKASQLHDLTAQKDKIASTPNDRLSPEAKRARTERIDAQIKRITESTSRTFARVYR